MPTSREELDALFNSSNNNVEDERVKDYDSRSKESNDYITDMESDISSNRPSILEDATKAEEDAVEEQMDDITLDDLKGVEESNIPVAEEDEKEEEPEEEKDKSASTNSSGRVPLEFYDNDDEEIVLDDLSDSEEDTEIEEESVTEEPEDKEPPEKEDSNEGHNEVSDIDDKDLIQNNLDNEEETDDFSKVCHDRKYLDDPRYHEFYRQKLRAYNFLKQNVPQMDYGKLREQLEEFHVSVHMQGVTSLDQFNEKIQQIQAIRNRLTKIRSLCIQNYVPRKRVIRLLEDCLMKVSQEKSNDKRSGEIQVHLSDMEYQLTLAETFMKDVEQIMENVTNAHEAISRQITVIQERNKEIQRGQEPYVDNTQNNYDSVLAEDKEGEDSVDAVSISTKWKKMM